MRLGLLLAEVGAKVGRQDQRRGNDAGAGRPRPRLSPARKSRSGTSIANNQQALAELRAPIYEEKVVDHILAVAKVEDRKVTAKELLADDDEPAPANPAA